MMHLEEVFAWFVVQHLAFDGRSLVKRKLPGTAIPREQLVAQWEDLRHRILVKGPVASLLFDVHYSYADTLAPVHAFSGPLGSLG